MRKRRDIFLFIFVDTLTILTVSRVISRTSIDIFELLKVAFSELSGLIDLVRVDYVVELQI
jgi:hypothetical protein